MKLQLLFVFTFFISGLSFAQEKKNGKLEIRNGDGSLSVGENKNWKKEGKWITTSTSGLLSKEENYHDGIYHGYYAKYHKNGKLNISGNYVNGLKEGTWYLLTEKGDTTRVDNFLNDTLHGYCRIRNSFGQLFEGQHVHGKREGVWVTTAHGNVEYLDSTQYLNDNYSGYSRTYRNGWLIYEYTYRDGKKHGTETEFYEGTRQIKSISQYDSGRVTGVHRKYFSDGTKERYTFYGGTGHQDIDSIWKQADGKTYLYSTSTTSGTGYTTYHERFDPNGQIRYRQFGGDDWQLDSTLSYHTNGVISRRRIYISNDSKAVETEYSSKGRVIYRGEDINGHKVGVGTHYDSITGKKTKQITYVHGRAEGRYTDYYSNGKIRVTGVCRANNFQDSIKVYSSSGVLLTKGSTQYKDVLNRMLLENPELQYRDPDEPIEETAQEDIAATSEEGPIEEIDANAIVHFAETMPSFPGDTLDKWIAKNLQYPAHEREQGKSGTVYIWFVVETDGSISNVTVAKGVPGATGLNNEAIRVISTMPKWNPGKMNDRPVRVHMTQPVRFTLR
jgi:TonB family protein